MYAAAAPGSSAAASPVARQYDAQARVTESPEERESSRTAGMRGFHNWVKGQLLHSAATHCAAAGEKHERLSLLDLGCGRGGDLHKWKAERCGYVVGCDVSEASLVEAQSRYSTVAEREGKGNKKSPEEFWGFRFETLVFNMFEESLDQAQPSMRIGDQFDVVSSQFSLHYGFGSLKQARQLLANVVTGLKPGRVFVCTFCDGKSVLKHLVCESSSSDAVASEALFQIKPNFTITPRAALAALERWEADEVSAVPEHLFGLGYSFFLEKHVENIPEFVVSMRMLEVLASEVGLKKIAGQSFKEWCGPYRKSNAARRRPRMTANQIAVSSLYSSVVFVLDESAKPVFAEAPASIAPTLAPSQPDVVLQTTPSPYSGLSGLVDIGANLTRYSREQLGLILDRSAAAGVDSIILTGTNLKSSLAAVQLASEFGGSVCPVRLYATAGVHPHDAKTWNASTRSAIKSLLEKSPDIVAVGECGLDFDRNFSPQEQQLACFRDQLALAREVGNHPIFLHERSAHAEFVKELLAHSEESGGDLTKCCVHCFTGTANELQTYVEMGCYIGITGFICNPSRGVALRQCVADIVPLNRLMIETDAPFMMPTTVPSSVLDAFVARTAGKDGRGRGHNRGRGRGKGKNNTARPRVDNEPCFLPYVADTLAALYNIPIDQLAQQTARNAIEFFGLDSKQNDAQNAEIPARDETCP